MTASTRDRRFRGRPDRQDERSDPSDRRHELHVVRGRVGTPAPTPPSARSPSSTRCRRWPLAARYVSATGPAGAVPRRRVVVTHPVRHARAGSFVPRVSLAARPPADSLGAMTNSVTVSARTHDPNPTNNTSTVDVHRRRASRPADREDPDRADDRRRSDRHVPPRGHQPRSVDLTRDHHGDRHPAGETTFVVRRPPAGGDPWDCTHSAGVVSCSLAPAARTAGAVRRPPVRRSSTFDPDHHRGSLGHRTGDHADEHCGRDPRRDARPGSRQQHVDRCRNGGSAGRPRHPEVRRRAAGRR